jgi:GNAT superfamily N-acetyltransferase
MILTSPEIALTLEYAEAQHLRLQVEAYRQLSKCQNARAVPVAGGIAAFTVPEFGRKLNHVTGFGMGVKPNQEILVQLEQAYANMGLPVEIDVCPHSDSNTLTMLAARGYHVNAFSNTFARKLDDMDLRPSTNQHIRICSDRAQLESDFVAHSVAGFSVQANQRPTVLLQTLAQIAVSRNDSSLFSASIHDDIAGTAGMSIISTPLGKLAHLYIASTLPAHRGKGVQTALLKARLAAARQEGCILAFVTARPANTSARNAERAGFGLAYTKVTFVQGMAE